MDHEIIQTLTDAHRNMQRVLMLIRLQVDTLRPGDDASGFALLSNALSYLRNYPGVIHHPVEDVVFRKLMFHAPELRPTCMRLSEQHQLFRWTESRLLRYILVAQAGDAKACQEFKLASVAYCIDHSRHINSEEIEVFPEAVKRLDAGDWEEISDQSRRLLDPVLEKDELQKYSNLYDYLMSSGRSFNVH